MLLQAASIETGVKNIAFLADQDKITIDKIQCLLAHQATLLG